MVKMVEGEQIGKRAAGDWCQYELPEFAPACAEIRHGRGQIILHHPAKTRAVFLGKKRPCAIEVFAPALQGEVLVMAEIMPVFNHHEPAQMVHNLASPGEYGRWEKYIY